MITACTYALNIFFPMQWERVMSDLNASRMQLKNPGTPKGKKHDKPFNDVISPVGRVVGLLEEMPDTPIKIVGIIRGNSSLPETNQ
jgi:hypothetical protein